MEIAAGHFGMLWKPTMQLRWLRVLPEQHDCRLEQMWISETGEQDWRAVPVAEGDKK